MNKTFESALKNQRVYTFLYVYNILKQLILALCYSHKIVLAAKKTTLCFFGSNQLLASFESLIEPSSGINIWFNLLTNVLILVVKPN